MRPTKKEKIIGRYAMLPKKYLGRFRNKVSPVSLDVPSDTTKKAAESFEQSKELTKVIDNAQETLLKVYSVFPFMLFTDSLSVDRQKVTITHRSFFSSAKIINIQMIDIQMIEADIGPIFGSLCITSKQFSGAVNKILYLTRSDAVRAQRLIQGFVIANEKQLDYSSIDKKKLRVLLNDLGQGNSD